MAISLTRSNSGDCISIDEEISFKTRLTSNGSTNSTYLNSSSSIANGNFSIANGSYESLLEKEFYTRTPEKNYESDIHNYFFILISLLLVPLALIAYVLRVLGLVSFPSLDLWPVLTAALVYTIDFARSLTGLH